MKTKATPVPGIRSYSNHPLLESCLASVIPYFDVKEPFPENLALLKITEAISILRTIDPDIDRVLANFEGPHKVELVSFMEKNYMVLSTSRTRYSFRILIVQYRMLTTPEKIRINVDREIIPTKMGCKMLLSPS